MEGERNGRLANGSGWVTRSVRYVSGGRQGVGQLPFLFRRTSAGGNYSDRPITHSIPEIRRKSTWLTC
jgi:hypothetical protein